MASLERSNKPGRQAKLRNSCDACSMAKVKCTKEKPVCTRCIKRGQLCMYGTSKRAGRPSQSKMSRSGSATATYVIPKTSSPLGSPGSSVRDLSSTPTNTSMFPSTSPDLTSASQIWSDICATLISSPGKSSGTFRSNSATEMDYYSSMGSVASGCDTPESYFDDMPLPTTEMDMAPDYGTCGFDLPYTTSPVPLDCSNRGGYGEAMGQFPPSLMSPNAVPFYMQHLPGNQGFGADSYMADSLNMMGSMGTISHH